MKIEIDGKEYGFLWGLPVFRDYADDMGVSRVDDVYIHVLDSIENQYKLYYFAIQNYIKNKDETAELPFTFRRFVNHLDTLSEDIHEAIMLSFRKSTFSGKTMDEHYAYLSEVMSSISETSLNDNNENEGDDKKKEVLK